MRWLTIVMFSIILNVSFGIVNAADPFGTPDGAGLLPSYIPPEGTYPHDTLYYPEEWIDAAPYQSGNPLEAMNLFLQNFVNAGLGLPMFLIRLGVPNFLVAPVTGMFIFVYIIGIIQLFWKSFGGMR